MKENNYYNKKVEELYKELNTNISGLTEEEASKRLEEYGENKLAERKKKSNFIIFLNQFNDLMIILLIFASVFSAVISYIQKESYADSVIILIIVIINATLSFIEEKKADKAIEELNKMFITNNNVIRDGKKEVINDNSDSSIAKMIIKGVSTGSVDMEKKIKAYDKDVDKSDLKIAKEFLKFQEKTIDELKEYL
jgi:magnesium-transporting ATPase (P-type)